MRRPLAALALLPLLTLLAPAPHDALAAGPDAPFRVVVNAANPAASASRQDLSRIFLRRTQLWPDGKPAVPVDLPEAAPARAAFSQQVVGKNVAAVKGYWQQQVFTGRGVPPVVKATEADVLGFVAATPGAVGYVSASAELPAAVKALKVEE